MKTERRLSPRTAMERLAYIGIEPDNGGIVLNVSSGGLCFHSIVPVEPGKRVRFSATDHNFRIEADGEMVWTDQSGTAGGLRFHNVPTELTDQIRRWVNPMVTIVENTADRTSEVTSPAPKPRFQPTASVAQKPERPTMRVRIRLGGYARGVLTGLVFSALLASGILVQAYRNRLGESLIRLGQRIAGAPQIVASAPQPITNLRPKLTSTSDAVTAVASSFAKHFADQQADSDYVVTRVITPSSPTTLEPRRVLGGKTAIAAVAKPPVPPAITLPVGAALPHLPAAVTVPLLSAPDKPGLVNEESPGTPAGPPPQMYFEVGKFKQEVAAQSTRDRLSMLGLPASIVEKGRLWTSSYHILVGPYDDESNARAASHTLVSRGYQPRPYERGSRDFTFSSKLVVNQTTMPVGDCEIRWESYVPNAVVKIVQNYGVVAQVSGRWEKRANKFQHNAVVYQRNPNGSRSLIEIQFAGMDRALVFDKVS